jgi:SNF2 family DNA or RNA helicase
MLGQLLRAGFKSVSGAGVGTLQLPVKLMPLVANELIGSRWTVKADQKMIRGAGTPSLSITSGVDWFELRGGVRYETGEGEQVVPLPEILAAAREGRRLVTLGDGTQGMLPEEWLRRHNLLTAIGEMSEDGLRFKMSQAALLDALLDARELDDVDAKFESVRKRLHDFEGVKTSEATESFGGELRPYQKEGLGWVEFLNWFGMGGILADDMGLGKTVQVLALLEKRDKIRAAGGEEAAALGEKRPTLVVAPKSVVFNWVDEAKRFTPHLKVLNYAGAERAALREEFDDTDIIVTSYGLLRRDIAVLKDMPLDYAVLDEAQVIKNPSSQSAKAARLLNTQHRLALTGTPVENHMGDLWSIFEFVNPGMLGSSVRFSELLRGGVQDPSNLDAARQVGAALRPFILRRTKGQVLTELPEKTEQTIVCELDDEQRKIYDNLREHYRGTLLQKIDAARGSGTKSGVGGNAMMVLEALLRLRQAACHPGLIDAAHAEGPSAKLDALMEQLHELHEEGHKALVFSQFTSMLSLVQKRLNKEGIRYEYLDGKTRNRKERVERFQNDPDCPLFLISLKAGGLGLNLTSAQYVFILDPWWNPAVEAQAIDRAHRIGQESHVTAYRLICQDTVEQRIAELQEKKRKLADAIVGGEENLLRTLTRDELDRLLS